MILIMDSESPNSYQFPPTRNEEQICVKKAKQTKNGCS